MELVKAYSKQEVKLEPQKKVLDVNKVKYYVLGGMGLFTLALLFMPNTQDVEFYEKKLTEKSSDSHSEESVNSSEVSGSAQRLWESPKSYKGSYYGGSHRNMDDQKRSSSMIVSSFGDNAKNKLSAGARLPLIMVDRVIVSEEPVPIYAELVRTVLTESGVRLEAGAKFYGEAIYNKTSGRAFVRFAKMSLISGEIKEISAQAIDHQGQLGIKGKVFSNSIENSTGQLITTFVGGLAGGSMATDVFGRSKGGIENGLLNAVAETAKTRADRYGEKLKNEREWVEVSEGTEFNVLLNEAYSALGKGGNNE